MTSSSADPSFPRAGYTGWGRGRANRRRWGPSVARQCSLCEKPIDLSRGAQLWEGGAWVCLTCAQRWHHAWRLHQKWEKGTLQFQRGARRVTVP